MPERGTERRDVLETELDAERLEGEQAVEQLSVARDSSRAGAPTATGTGSSAATATVAPHEAQGAGDGRLHLAAIDHQVEHAVLDQELAALEPVGQLLPDRLLDDARSGEADQRLRLGDVEVAEHREAGGHAAGRRIGEHRDERQPGAVEPGQRRRDLGHLHQRQRAFHHAGAAGAGDDDGRLPAGERHLDRPGDLLADHHAHAAADERVLHRGDDHAEAVEAARWRR